MIPPRIESVKALDNFWLKIIYKNGEIKKYNMQKNLKYNFYKNLNNISYFKLVKSVDTTVEWPNGEDLDPNDLYENSVNYINWCRAATIVKALSLFSYIKEFRGVHLRRPGLPPLEFAGGGHFLMDQSLWSSHNAISSPVVDRTTTIGPVQGIPQ